jgi:hypothetical protein
MCCCCCLWSAPPTSSQHLALTKQAHAHIKRRSRRLSHSWAVKERVNVKGVAHAWHDGSPIDRRMASAQVALVVPAQVLLPIQQHNLLTAVCGGALTHQDLVRSLPEACWAIWGQLPHCLMPQAHHSSRRGITGASAAWATAAGAACSWPKL